MDKIFVVYSCNEWGDYSSRRVVKPCKNMSAVRRVLDEEIHRGDMEISGNLIELTANEDLRALNDALTYGVVEAFDVEE